MNFYTKFIRVENNVIVKKAETIDKFYGTFGLFNLPDDFAFKLSEKDKGEKAIIGFQEWYDLHLNVHHELIEVHKLKVENEKLYFDCRRLESEIISLKRNNFQKYGPLKKIIYT